MIWNRYGSGCSVVKLPTQNVPGETLESHANLRTTNFRLTFDVWTSSTFSRIANNRLVEIK